MRCYSEERNTVGSKLRAGADAILPRVVTLQYYIQFS